MGNNHDKYFNQNKRKVLIVGLSGAGKTSIIFTFSHSQALLRMIKGDKKGKSTVYVPTELFNNEQIRMKKNCELDVWDLGGKLPHLWGHYFKGAQGIIFVIDDIQTALDDQRKQQVIQELLNVIVGNSNIPIGVFVNLKTSLLKKNGNQLQQHISIIDSMWIKDNVLDKIQDQKFGMIKVFHGDLMSEKSLDQLQIAQGEKNVIYDCVSWLVDKMKPL